MRYIKMQGVASSANQSGASGGAPQRKGTGSPPPPPHLQQQPELEVGNCLKILVASSYLQVMQWEYLPAKCLTVSHLPPQNCT